MATQDRAVATLGTGEGMAWPAMIGLTVTAITAVVILVLLVVLRVVERHDPS